MIVSMCMNHCGRWPDGRTGEGMTAFVALTIRTAGKILFSCCVMSHRYILMKIMYSYTKAFSLGASLVPI